MDYNVNPSVNFEITSTANMDIFKETNVTNYLANFNLTSDKIAKDGCRIKATIIPSTACNVKINGYSSSCKEFYSTGDYTNVKSLIIVEAGIQFTLVLSIA